MAKTKKDPVLVVLQLTGGNDYFNTLIPYTDPRYKDYRPYVGIPDEQVLKLDDTLGLHPSAAPFQDLYSEGKMAVIHGVGWPNSPRSHFRAMDIWHTCEPDKNGEEGWLGRSIRELDPNKENVATGINFGYDLPRALTAPGVPVACVVDLETYGLMPGISEEAQRAKVLDRFRRMYAPALGSGMVDDYVGQTGLDAMKGADILKMAPLEYTSSVEYADSPIAKKLKGIAQVHTANMGSRIFYCDHGSFDTHANQAPVHAKLLQEVTEGVRDFLDDLREHDAADNVLIFLFSEFGRRIPDNGSGTDHGAAGPCFVIGDMVKGGIYGEYPSTKPEDLQQGDLVPSIDFRSVYSTILEQHLGLDPVPIVNGTFEQPAYISSS